MEQGEKNQTRRSFLFTLGFIGTMLISAGIFFRNVFAFLFPPRKEKTFHKYLVSKEGELQPGEAKEITLGRKPVFIVRLADGYKVFSGVCTHLGCIVRWEAEKERFYCPCHKGIFDKTGQVTSGPPPRPLDEYQVVVERNLVFIYVEDKTRGPWA